jgi:hypothetical protein
MGGTISSGNGQRTKEAIAVTALNQPPEPWSPYEELSIDELARQQGIEPIQSLSDLAQPGLFESDEEYEEFLIDLYASRRSDVA